MTSIILYDTLNKLIQNIDDSPDNTKQIYRYVVKKFITNLNLILDLFEDTEHDHNSFTSLVNNNGLNTITSRYVIAGDIRNKKIKIIKNWLKAPDLPDILKKIPYMNHQILFNKPIKVSKYVVGIICDKCSKYKTNKLTKALKKYPNIKLILDSSSLPKLNKDDMIKN